MLQKFLDSIKCTKQDLGKSCLCKKAFIRTSGNAYKITLSYRGHRCTFIFCDNSKNESTKEDYLYSLWLDASCYDESRDVYDFARTFGYDYTCESMQKVRSIFNACKKQSENLHRLFNEQEINLISQLD